MNDKNEKPKRKPSLLTPIEERIPLVEVVFMTPVELQGFPALAKRILAQVPRADGTPMPAFSFDPKLRVVVVGRDLIPAERVSKMRRAH